MLEMLDVNAPNATTTTITVPTVYENNIHTNNGILNYANATTTDTAADAILTDVVMNTTAAVVDYAAQWLTTTIATVAANITTAINESTTSASSLALSTTPSYSSASAATISPSALSYNDSSTYYNDSFEADEDDYPECHEENPNFNCSRMRLLEFILGPQTQPLYKALLVTIANGIIFISGILGNVLVCVVIVRHRGMHTATNYYLFSLAVSDLIYLIFGLPTEVFLYWHQYPFLFGLTFCKVRAYISEACSYVSVFTIVAFSVERYLAICHPLHQYAMSGFKRALRIIVLLWVISFIGAIPFGLLSELKYVTYPLDNEIIEDSAFCTMDPPRNLFVFEISFVVFFFIPMILIIYFYGRMGAKIRSRTTQKLGVQKGSMHRESQHQQSRKAVIRMLSAVVLTFFICWLPFHAQRLLFVYHKQIKYYQEINECLFSITGFVYYVSCTVNPILYNVMSHRYRVAFKATLCGKRRSVFHNNGFARDQSSFRETTVVTSLSNNGNYDRVNSKYRRSIRITNNLKDRISIKSNNVTWKNIDFNTPLDKDIPENHAATLNSTNAVVVCVDNGVNGRTKVFTENEAQESLLNKNNETCI